ncbi:MAG: sulfur carrier protein ThiS [Pseudomonadota bacterium]
MTIKITLNGTGQEFEASMTLDALARDLGLDPRKVAIERNHAVVPKSAYDTTPVEDGDCFEIVQFVGGG